jgi:hypothetical protein
VDIEDFADIKETHPLKIVLEIDKRIRPNLSLSEDRESAQAALEYFRKAKHACQVFGIPFSVEDPTTDSFTDMRDLFIETKMEMDKKKIDWFGIQFKLETEVLKLDQSWREKIHSYIAIIRGVVEARSAPRPKRK